MLFSHQETVDKKVASLALGPMLVEVHAYLPWVLHEHSGCEKQKKRAGHPNYSKLVFIFSVGIGIGVVISKV